VVWPRGSWVRLADYLEKRIDHLGQFLFVRPAQALANPLGRQCANLAVFTQERLGSFAAPSSSVSG